MIDRASISTSARRGARTAATRYPWLIDAYRFATDPKQELRLHQDLASFRRDWAFVPTLARPDGPSAGRTVLFCLYRDDVYEAKLAIMLAAGAAMAGATPIFSVPTRRFRHSSQLIESSGLGELRVLEPLVADGERIDADVHDLLVDVDRTRDLEAAKQIRLGGHEVGVLALSALFRRTEGLVPDLHDAPTWAAFRALLRTAVLNDRRADALLTTTEPDVVVLREPGYVESGPIVDAAVARDIDVIEIGPAKRDDALLFKRLRRDARRALPLSVAPETFFRAERVPWNDHDERALEEEFTKRYGGAWALQRLYNPTTDASVITRDELLAQLELPSDRPVAVIYSHVLWDATFWGGDDLFGSYAEWFSATVTAAAANDAVSWVVKTHPANLFRHRHGDVSARCAELTLIDEALPSLPDHVRVLLPDSSITALSLYRNADAGVTVRGAPGFEMPCFGKPALTAGNGVYIGLGFTVDSTTPEQYLARIAAIQDLEPLDDVSVTRAKRYALLMLRDRSWQMRSFRNVFSFADEGWDPLDRNLVPILGDADAVRSAGDLERWASWLLDSHDLDYLEAPEIVRDGAPA